VTPEASSGIHIVTSYYVQQSPQLVKEFPAFYATGSFIIPVTNNRTTVPILSHLSPVNAVPSRSAEHQIMVDEGQCLQDDIFTFNTAYGQEYNENVFTFVKLNGTALIQSD
jgi:hypothetical protein